MNTTVKVIDTHKARFDVIDGAGKVWQKSVHWEDIKYHRFITFSDWETVIVNPKEAYKK